MRTPPLRLLSLASCALAVACNDAAPRPAQPSLGAHREALSWVRDRVVTAHEGSLQTEARQLKPAPLIEHLEGACAYEATVAWDLTIEELSSKGSGDSMEFGPVGVGRMLRNSCVAQWASTFGETLVPVYLGTVDRGDGGGTVPYVSFDPETAGESVAKLFPKAGAPSIEWVIPPASTRDAVTWLLAAAERFRLVSTGSPGTYQFLFEQKLGVTWPEERTVVSADGQEVSESVLAAYLASEALIQMVEVASKAQRKIAALAARHQADPAGQLASWRGAQASRLDGASLYVNFPYTLMDGFEKIVVYQITGAGAGSVERRWSMTRPESVPEHAEVIEHAAVPTDGPAPPGAIPSPDLPVYFVREPFFAPDDQPVGQWPVVPSAALTEAQQLSAELLRSRQINPFQDGKHMAADLRAVLNADFAGTLELSTDALLLELGLKTTDLEVAAGRLITEAEALGRTIVRVPDSSAPPRYAYPKRTARGLDPAFLYAATQGRSASVSPWMPWESGGMSALRVRLYSAGWGEGPDYAHVSPRYASQGVFHAIDYFRAKYEWLKDRSDVPSEVVAALNSAYAFTETLTSGDPLKVVTDLSEGRVTQMRIVVYGSNLTSAEEVRRRYDVWASNAGLECATRRSVSGLPCEHAELGFADEQAWRIDDRGQAVLVLRPQDAPGAVYGEGATQLASDVPLYVVERDANGQSQVILGVFPIEGSQRRSKKTNGTVWKLMPRIGAGLREALVRTLMPNPLRPATTVKDCSGEDTRVKLEDELIPVSQDDPYDTSFQYYLAEARKAADFADQLGEELIRQGLEMDMRAEGAAAELEALCGGTINVGRLREHICGDDTTAPETCDLVQALQDTTKEWPEALRSDVESVRRCLAPTTDDGPGSGSNSLKWATIGDQPLCAWRFKYDAAGKYPLGVCPETVSEGGQERKTRCPEDPYPALREPCEWPEYPDVEAVPIYETLNVTVTSKDAKPEPSVLNQWLWYRTAKLYADGLIPDLEDLLRGKGAAWLQATEDVWGSWATQQKMRDVATAMGVAKDWEGNMEITLNGSPWLELDRLFAAWNALHPDYPHSQSDLAELSPAQSYAWLADDPNLLGDRWTELPWPCGPLDESLIELCEIPELSGDRPLVCGGLCSPWRRQALGKRLEEGLRALKTVSGAPWNNVVGPRFRTWELDEAREALGGTWAHAGLAPFPNGEGERVPYFVGQDLETGDVVRCYDYPTGASGLVDLLQSHAGYNEPKYCGTIGLSPAPLFVDPNPSYLWSTSDCRKDSSRMEDSRQGCGAIPKFLLGWQDWVRGVSLDWDSTECITETLQRCERGVGPSSDGMCVVPGPNGWNKDDIVYAPAVTWFRRTLCGPEQKEGLADVYQPRFGWRLTVQRWVKGWTQAGVSVSGKELLDGFAMVRAMENMGVNACGTLWREMVEVDSARDLSDLRTAIMCAADAVEMQLTRMVLPALPQDVIEDLRMGVVRGSLPRNRGAYGQTLAELVATAQNLGRQSDTIVQAMRDLGNELDIGRARLTSLDLDLKTKDLERYINELREENEELKLDAADLEQRIANLRKGQAIANQLTSCLTATFSALPTVSAGFPGGASVSYSPGAALSAAATCANSSTQIGLEVAIGNARNDLTDNTKDQIRNQKRILEAVDQQIAIGQQVTEQDKRVVLLELQRSAAEKADAINEAATALNETYARLHSLVTSLDTHRNQARRAAAKVLLLDNDDMGRVFNVNRAMRARMNTLRVRYEKAHEAAIRAAYKARRAIEQKIGMDLSSIDKDLGYVGRPSEWVDQLCSLPGVDYRRVRDPQQRGEDGANPEDWRPGQELLGEDDRDRLGYDFTLGYVGDYVTKLEQFIDAYRNAYAFQDGDDTMVISLRDELLNVRRNDCDVRGSNELLASTVPLGQPWTRTCAAGWCADAAPAQGAPFACTSSGYSGDSTPACRGMGGAVAVRLRYAARVEEDADGEGGGTDDRAEATAPAGAVRDAAAPRYRQTVPAWPGLHRVSWHEPAPCSDPSTLVVELADGYGDFLELEEEGCIDAATGAVSTNVLAGLADRWLSPGWSRRFASVELHGDEVTLSFRPRQAPMTDLTPEEQPSATFAAPQLERVERRVSALPNPWFPTDDDLLASVGTCEDTDGSKFREGGYWEYGCEYYCPGGADRDCAALADRRALPQRCYYELSFRLSQDDIEAAKLIHQGGFATGNFNYRHDSFAVNLVGSGVKNCAVSETPTSCFASNFAQFTLHHDGPFTVRNFDNALYHAPLYPVRVQQGKALLAERYLTNPLSGADRGLLTDYWRDELRGRPLEGNYTLRVYDSPEMNWQALEDVQLLVNYRYWTRLE